MGRSKNLFNSNLFGHGHDSDKNVLCLLFAHRASLSKNPQKSKPNRKTIFRLPPRGYGPFGPTRFLGRFSGFYFGGCWPQQRTTFPAFPQTFISHSPLGPRRPALGCPQVSRAGAGTGWGFIEEGMALAYPKNPRHTTPNRKRKSGLPPSGYSPEKTLQS